MRVLGFLAVLCLGCQPTGLEPFCGDGVVDLGEACDDGNNVSGDGCEVDCSLSCGNGVLDAGEFCDDGNNVSGDGCLAACNGVEFGHHFEGLPEDQGGIPAVFVTGAHLIHATTNGDGQLPDSYEIRNDDPFDLLAVWEVTVFGAQAPGVCETALSGLRLTLFDLFGNVDQRSAEVGPGTCVATGTGLEPGQFATVEVRGEEGVPYLLLLKER